MWNFFPCWTWLYSSCIIALPQMPSGGVKLTELHFSHCIDCTSSDVFPSSPGKVRVCSAIHIDWWIKWAAERTRMNFVFVNLRLLLILILPGHRSTQGTSMLCLILNKTLYWALISLLSLSLTHTHEAKQTLKLFFYFGKKHMGNHSVHLEFSATVQKKTQNKKKPNFNL